ncbi:Virulence-associated protein E [Roseovarius litoreus]|uniref:Virulence-associated protein E n=1 Tax=Roseovarius litoreus TaxID=1155722 RepID=A0A1M7LNX2_9RHOB|nr:virulence-associated E family protein [Roseovarius litoreus]SHM79853.1 Virulence-associated protein E [Roseovarius litoreus]
MIAKDNPYFAVRKRLSNDSGLSYRNDELPLIRDDKKRPIWNMANAITLLTDHGDWQSVLGFNQFTMRRVLLRAVPGQRGGEYPRPLEDDDYSAAQAWFNRNGFPRASMEIVRAAVRKVCRHQSYDPLRDYLDGLQWDGTRRLNSWLADYCGAELSEYLQEVGKRWCISAVARGFKPGCKADHMLVLEGAQGRKKSTALATLAGEDWFSDALPQMGTKDASSYLRGKWIIEVGELEAMRKEVDAIKAFITRQVETFRPAYGREEVSEPRRCVFAGTTNKDDWQRDETGGRRFWPVRVGEIDVDGLARDRNQIWAEAVMLYRKGERWWIEGEVAEQAQAEVADRRPDDPWRADIARVVQSRSEITAKQVLGEMGVLPCDMTPILARRVTQELVALGWERAGRITSGEGKGAARYIPGEDAVRVR